MNVSLSPVNDVHTREITLKCEQRDKSYTQAHHLSRHQQMHTKEKSCQLCDKSFTQLCNLEIHQIMYTRENLINASNAIKYFLKYVPLQIMNEFIPQKSRLNVHRAVHRVVHSFVYNLVHKTFRTGMPRYLYSKYLESF